MRKIYINQSIHRALNEVLWFIPDSIVKFTEYAVKNAEIAINLKDGEIVIRIKKELP